MMASNETAPFLTSLPYYDSLVEQSIKNATSTRKGNLRVIPAAEEGTQHKELGICSLAVLFPFSDGVSPPGEHVHYIYFENAAAMLLAAEHLNTGNGDIVKDVEGLNKRCNIRFTTELLDSQLQQRPAVDAVIELTDREYGPCAIMGAARSAVSMPTSIITGLRGYPQISTASTSPALNDPSQYPLFGRTVPSDDTTAIPVVIYIRKTLNVKHLGVFYVNDAFGSSFYAGIQNAAQEYAPDLVIVGVEIPFSATDADFRRAIQNLRASEYRYFYCIPLGRPMLDNIMIEASDQGIAGTGDHTWFFAESATFILLGRHFRLDDPVERKIHNALQGTGVISASAGVPGESESLDRFMASHEQLINSDDLEYLISTGPSFAENVSSAEMAAVRPSYGHSFSPWAYDGGIAIGLAACNAAAAKQQMNATENDYFTGEEHFDAFKRLNFTGASGQIVFNSDHGSRDPTSSYYVLTNFQFEEDASSNVMKVSDVLSGVFESGGWRSLVPYRYGDGSIYPHEGLPTLVTEDNHLTAGWRAVGLLMCAIGMFLAVGCMLWTARHRNTRQVRASQPIFLYLVCAGALILVSSIIPLSFDEGSASAQGCTIACTAFFWQLFIGFSITFCALFTKTYRVNRIMNQPHFKRIKVTALDVAKPMIVILGANLLLLALMTGLAPVVWSTEVMSLDNFNRPTETRGYCDWSGSIPYLVPLGLINFCCVVFAVIQAYSARRISTELQESEFIFKSMLVILLASLFCFPVIILIHDIPVALYFVIATTIFILAASVLLLIFVPKIRFLWRQGNTPQRPQTINRQYTLPRTDSQNVFGLDLSRASASVAAGLSIASEAEEEGIRIIHHPQDEERLRRENERLREKLKAVLRDNSNGTRDKEEADHEISVNEGTTDSKKMDQENHNHTD